PRGLSSLIRALVPENSEAIQLVAEEMPPQIWTQRPSNFFGGYVRAVTPSPETLHLLEANILHFGRCLLVGMDAKTTKEPWQADHLRTGLAESNQEIPVDRKAE